MWSRWPISTYRLLNTWGKSAIDCNFGQNNYVVINSIKSRSISTQHMYSSLPNKPYLPLSRKTFPWERFHHPPSPTSVVQNPTTSGRNEMIFPGISVWWSQSIRSLKPLRRTNKLRVKTVLNKSRANSVFYVRINQLDNVDLKLPADGQMPSNVKRHSRAVMQFYPLWNSVDPQADLNLYRGNCKYMDI